MLVGAAILGLALVVLFASLTRWLVPAAFCLATGLLVLAVLTTTGDLTVSIMSGGLAVVGLLLLQSVRETSHVLAVARRDRGRTRRRRPRAAIRRRDDSTWRRAA